MPLMSDEGGQADDISVMVRGTAKRISHQERYFNSDGFFSFKIRPGLTSYYMLSGPKHILKQVWLLPLQP